MSHVTIIVTPCRMSLSSMSHVESKKMLCRPVDFRGQVSYPSHTKIRELSTGEQGNELWNL